MLELDRALILEWMTEVDHYMAEALAAQVRLRDQASLDAVSALIQIVINPKSSVELIAVNSWPETER